MEVLSGHSTVKYPVNFMMKDEIAPVPYLVWVLNQKEGYVRLCVYRLYQIYCINSPWLNQIMAICLIAFNYVCRSQLYIIQASLDCLFARKFLKSCLCLSAYQGFVFWIFDFVLCMICGCCWFESLSGIS